MGILFSDSFSHYSTEAISAKWPQMGRPASVTMDPTGGPRGKGAMVIGDGGKVQRAIPVTQNGTIGVRMKLESPIPSGFVLAFRQWADSGPYVVAGLKVTALGAFEAYACLDAVSSPVATLQGTSDSEKITAGAYAFVEFQIRTASGSSTLEVRVNNATVLNLSGIVINGLAIDHVGLENGTFADMYITNNVPPQDGFLGPLEIIALPVIKVGNYSEFLAHPVGASHANLVSDATVGDLTAPNSTTGGYVHTTLINKKETFHHKKLLAATAIYMVQVSQTLREVGGPLVGVESLVIDTGVSAGYDVGRLTVGYHVTHHRMMTDLSGVAWTPTSLSLAQFGVSTKALT